MQFLTTIVILSVIVEQLTAAPADTTGPSPGSTKYHKENDKESNKNSWDYHEEVGEGLNWALDECRQKFKWEPWNCPRKTFSSVLHKEGHPLPSSKELSVASAFLASGIVLSMVKSCSTGTNNRCSCTNPTIVPLPNNDILTPGYQGKDAMFSINSPPPMNSQTDQMIETQAAPSIQTNHIMKRDEIMTQETDAVLMEQDQSINTDSRIESLPTATEPAKKSNFAWAGCEEILKSGLDLAKEYTNTMTRPSRGDASRLINLHNFNAGLEAVKRTMKRKCKCHGTSGTCQVNTCWTVLPDMSEVGEHLKREYGQAAKVGAASAKETDAASLKKELLSISSEKLVFADGSPDYCYESKELGVNGTLGRYCSRTKYRPDGTLVSLEERQSCDKLCTKCGYKVKRGQLKVDKQCDCRFVYCCSVECKKCPRVIETFKCVKHS